MLLHCETYLEGSWYTDLICSLICLGEGLGIIQVQVVYNRKLHFSGQSMPSTGGGGGGGGGVHHESSLKVVRDRRLDLTGKRETRRSVIKAKLGSFKAPGQS